MVDKPVGLHSGVEDQVGAEDVDVLAGEKDGRVNSDLSAEEEVFFITASLNTLCIERGYIDQTGIFFECCKEYIFFLFFNEQILITNGSSSET